MDEERTARQQSLARATERLGGNAQACHDTLNRIVRRRRRLEHVEFAGVVLYHQIGECSSGKDQFVT